MKKHAFINLIKAAALFVFASATISCSGLADVRNNADSAKETASIELQIGSNASRTITPYYEYINQMAKIVFSGKQTDGNATYEKTWNGESIPDATGSGREEWISAYQKLQEDPIVKDIPLGKWEFTLECYNKDSALICSGKTEKTLKRGNNGAITIELENVKGKGGIEISLNYSYALPANNSISEITATLKDMGGNIVDTKELIIDPDKFYATYTADNIPAGSYILSFTIGIMPNTGSSTPDYTTVSELVNVAPGLTTTGEKPVSSLNKRYTITYMGPEEGGVPTPITTLIAATGENLRCAWVNSPALDFTEGDIVILPSAKDIVVGKKDGQGVASYVLEGWYDDSNFSNKIETIDGSSKTDIVLYGRFVAIESAGYKDAYLGMKNATNFTVELTGDGVQFPQEWKNIVEWHSGDSFSLSVVSNKANPMNISVKVLKTSSNPVARVTAYATVKGIPISGYQYYIGSDLHKETVEALALDQGTTYADMTTFTVPEGYGMITEGTFDSTCANLTTVTLPESCIEIFSSAFNGCTSLSTIIVKRYKESDTNPITTCSDNLNPSFDNFDSLKTVYVPAEGYVVYAVNDSSNNWNNYSFKIQSLLTKEEVQKLKPTNYASTKTIVIPCEGTWGNFSGTIYTEIASDAFSELTDLEKINLPESIDKIYAGAFAGCTNLREATFFTNWKCFSDNDNVSGTQQSISKDSDSVNAKHLNGTLEYTASMWTDTPEINLSEYDWYRQH